MVKIKLADETSGRRGFPRLIPLTVAIAASLLISACGGGTPEGETDKAKAPPLSLFVSKTIADDLVPIRKARYDEPELEPFFNEMVTKGDDYCRMFWRHRPWDKKQAGEFIEPAQLKKYNDGCPQCVNNITAGCWNFFKMNDRRPDRDFRLVRNLYKDEPGFDCYSVGYIQPYIMHSELNCRELTMVDIDWRIIEGHHQMLQKYAGGHMATDEKILQTLKELRITWVRVTTFEPPQARPELDYKFYCGRFGKRQLCRTYLNEFEKKRGTIRKVRFQISALHDADYSNSDPIAELQAQEAERPLWERLFGARLKSPYKKTPVKVIYLSNAIETGYTSWEQFKQLRQNLEKVLAPGDRVVFIHHVGGHPTFGLYEMTGTQGGSTIKTLCRDPYQTTIADSDKPFYSIHLDRVSENKTGIPACSKLLGDEPPPPSRLYKLEDFKKLKDGTQNKGTPNNGTPNKTPDAKTPS